MMQAPTEILNEIAQEPTLTTPWAKDLFSLDQGNLTAAMEDQALRMEKAGYENKVILAYQTVAPLLAANIAISTYLLKTGNMELRAALPEVTTPEEGVQIAIAEFQLNEKQAKELLKLLTNLSLT